MSLERNRPVLVASGPSMFPGALGRETRRVASYLSVAMSSWMPAKDGLEKVIGVRVVRMRSPMVMA